MYNTFLRKLSIFCTSVVFLFAQDVILTLDGSDLNYVSTEDIYGIQFSHNGCVLDAGGGDAAAAGFSVSASPSVVLGFSFSGAIISAGEGTLLELDGEVTIDCLSNPIFSGDPDVGALDVVFAGGDDVCDDDSACNTGDEGDCEYAVTNYDCDGNCTANIDCLGECGGSAFEDSCGICNGDGTSCQNSVSLSLQVTDSGVDVFMNNTAPVSGFQFGLSGISLSGASGGSADNAGFSVSTGTGAVAVIGFSLTGSTIPAGDGLLTSLTGDFNAAESCIGDLILYVDAEGFLSVSTGDCVATGWTESEHTVDILYSSDADIYGFQFSVSGVDLTGASGGASEDAGFQITSSNDFVLGFSLTGGSIPAGVGVLSTLTYTGDGNPCLSNLILSGPGGSALNADIVDCLTISYNAPCVDVDEDGICDDIDDCVGAYDDCGICNGDGIAEGACDCDGSIVDCFDECGGSAVEDECGVCGGDGPADNFDCDGNCAVAVDCAGVCGGTAENCPAWEDCPSCYENTATMTAIVLDALSGDQMYDENDILAAFDVDGNVRGVALHLYPIPFGPYEGSGLYELQIRSDEAGDGISFKYYDASEDEILDSGTGYTFVIDDQIGDVVMPHEISVGAVQLNIDIASGWNWFSLNVEGDMGIGSVMGSLSSTHGDFIKSQSASSTYYGEENGWYGGLDEFGVTGMYKFDSANEDELVFSGAPVDPNTTPIALAAGWNWLGFTPQHDGPIGDALGSATTTAGDFIKNQAASSTYYGEENGWYGGLGVMAPTEGYMLDVAESSTLTYPDFGADDALTRATSAKDMPIAVSDWEVDYHDYEFNGHITMSIDSREDSYGDYIAVFVGDECRGVAERMYFPFGDSYMYSLMVYSNETGGETFTFKYYDSAIGEIVEYVETIDFTSDMIVGDGFNTYSLSREASDMQQPIAYGISDAYPNPFNPVTSFTYSLPEDGFVQIAIYDINGKMVSELTNGYTLAGSYPLVWNANNLSSGVYFIQMYSGDFASTQKIMLVK